MRTAAHLDLSHQTATRLSQLANAHNPEIDQAMTALTKLRTAGIDPELFGEAAHNYSLGRLYGLLDRLRHITPADERDSFEYRYLVIQPSLDESAFKLWGILPGHEGRIIEKALSQRETELPVLADQRQGQRRADAPSPRSVSTASPEPQKAAPTGR